MAIFGFKKRKDEKLEQNAQAAKSSVDKKSFSKSANSDKNTKQSANKPEKVAVSKVVAPKLQSELDSSLASVIIRPRVTEKSGVLSQGGVYTFEISKDANKRMVKKAVSTMYKVSPIKIAIVNTTARKIFVRGRKGTVAGIKKAIVTVKSGEKIDFV